MRTKLIVKGAIVELRFNQDSFFISILGVSSGWDYNKHDKLLGGKLKIWSTKDKIHLKCDAFIGFVVKGLGQPNFYKFLLDKSLGYNVFFERKTIHCKKKLF